MLKTFENIRKACCTSSKLMLNSLNVSAGQYNSEKVAKLLGTLEKRTSNLSKVINRTFQKIHELLLTFMNVLSYHSLSLKNISINFCEASDQLKKAQ